MYFMDLLVALLFSTHMLLLFLPNFGTFIGIFGATATLLNDLLLYFSFIASSE